MTRSSRAHPDDGDPAQLLKGGGGGGIGPMPSQSSIGSRVSQRGSSGRERGNVIRTPMHEAKEEEAMPANEILERLTDILKVSQELVCGGRCLSPSASNHSLIINPPLVSGQFHSDL
jgi:hypothetical protein